MRPSRILRRRMDSAGSQLVLKTVSRSLTQPRTGGWTPWTRNGVEVGVMVYATHHGSGTLRGDGYTCELCEHLPLSVRRALGLGSRCKHAGCPGLQELVGPDCATVFLDFILTVAWHDGIVRMHVGHLLGGASEHLLNKTKLAPNTTPIFSFRKCVTETQCSSHAWPRAQRRWRAPRRVLSLPLRCVRFMRLAHGTPTRPPKVRAARSPLLPQALRCPLR